MVSENEENAFARPSVGFGRLLSSRGAHAALLAAGTAFLLTGAFHGNIWFDESYSVAMASHSFADIWTIGSGDVHPVLFYWALHALYLLFGQSILAFRLFTVAGAVALASLGLALRRDFGWRVGMWFTFLAFFTPYVSMMAIEIRMYSWATFAVALCALMAWRIGACVRAVDGAGNRFSRRLAERAREHRCVAGVPIVWWVLFATASFASACLHYFGVLAAFVVNALLLACLLCHARKQLRALAAFLIVAFVQVACYVPWLLSLLSQAGVVSDGYWAAFSLYDLEQLLAYPVQTYQTGHASTGELGRAAQVAVLLSLALCALCLAAAAVSSLRRAFQGSRSADGSRGGMLPRLAASDSLPAWCAFAVYVGVFAASLAASFALETVVVYHRYLFIAIGPLLFAVAYAFSRLRSRLIAGGLCVGLLALSLSAQVLLVKDCYDIRNQAPIACFAREAAQTGMAVSSDIGVEGVTCVLCPDVDQDYLDWQRGNWCLAYQAYAPTLNPRDESSWDELFGDFQGRFIVTGQTSDGSVPIDIADLEARNDVTLERLDTYYRPYEKTYFTIAIMERA